MTARGTSSGPPVRPVDRRYPAPANPWSKVADGVDADRVDAVVEEVPGGAGAVHAALYAPRPTRLTAPTFAT
jgi:hypothetical protein